MQSEDMVPANEFCIHHDIELSFIQTLNDQGLIEIVLVDEKIFLPLSELARLERIVRLHFELDINVEGIEAIIYLLKREEEMQAQITHLTNLVRAYEKRDTNED